MKSYVMVDRDGVINVDLPTGVLRRSELRLEPSAAPAVARLTAAGVGVLICTNQSCVGRGELDPRELQRIHAAITGVIESAGGRIAGWYVCTHTPDDHCSCRKPEPGLLIQAQAERRFAAHNTWFVGDAERDVQAAHTAGCRPAIVLTGKGASAHAAFPEVPVFADLGAFADAYLSGALP